MSDRSLQDALGQWLRRQLEEGITVTEAVLDYLEATFGTRDLAEVLAGEDSSEVDSLLELIFYPDIDLQLLFESQWGQETFTEDDAKAVADILCRASLTARLKQPDSSDTLSLGVPDFACRTFVQRLRISHNLHPELSPILDKNPEDDTNGLIRVQLRNARLEWRDHQVALMALFLNHMPAQAGTLSADLDFLISILPEMATGDDAYTFLTGKKFFYFKSLCSAEDFERKRAASNMEIMMLSGARAAHGNIEEWRQLMRRVDRICQALFGRTEFFQQPDSHTVDLQDSRSLEDVVHKLS